MSNIARVFGILEMLVGEPGGVRITDIANELDLNRAIPHRILSELVELGYVAQDPVTERYRATFMLGSLGIRQLETAGIPRWARDELTALAEKSRELVRLAVATDHTMQFIAEAQGANSTLILDSPMVGDIALHATATGKAWLSSLPDEEVREILAARGMPAFTDRTTVSMDAICDEIRQARAAGYAVTHEEMEAGVAAIAAPVVPQVIPGGRAVGTVSVAGPSVRLTDERLQALAPAVTATAARLAAQWHVYEYLDALTAPDPAPIE
ncbi:MAG: IclR family transcriptional regulator [Actinobacteria bacterium]|nr:IclR family transcriptional regulator [Actinomycetota bacterium]